MDSLLAASLLNLLWSLASSIVFIGSPLAIIEVGGASWLLGLAALAYDASYIALSPLAGRLGDLGRRLELVALSSGFVAASALVAEASLWLRSPWLGVAAKLVLGVAGGVAVPNITALVVDAGVGRGKRPEELLARYYGASSTLGWLAGYLGGGLLAKKAGLWAPLALAAAVAAAIVPASLLSPRPPITLEHSVVAAKARIRLHHERVLRARFPRAREALLRLRRSPLLWFYLAVSTGFAGIGLFFSIIPAYWVRVRHLTPSDVMIYASMHTLVSTLVFLVVHRLVERLGAARSLALAFAARSLVFYEPIATEKLLPPPVQAALTYTLTGATWALLNTSLNTLALTLRLGGRGARLGVAQSASSTGLVAGDALTTITAYAANPRVSIEASSILEAAAALLTLRLALHSAKR